ncbi:MAG: NADH-quinone oxidoreductase subunit L, partial [Alphaproteobacteria bacterium]|nr:NADH-quinone oxidoreductase subunit L [Alphaproteobacteria bacterium]
CSQLGYMFVAVGMQAYGAGMFHLITHAFFKALLFLGAGSVIHALSGEQDIRHMGGLRRPLRYTFPLLLIGNLALCGIFPFAGFYSKDAILEAAYASHSVVAKPVYLGCMLVAVMTAFYSFRLLFRVFFGAPHPAAAADSHAHHDQDHGHHAAHHPNESPPSMILPLLPLALGAVAGGFLLEPWLLHAVDNFWQDSLVVHAHHESAVPLLIKWAPLLAGLFGIFLAWLFYCAKPTWPAWVARRLSALYELSYHKIYVDELYGWLIVRPLERAGSLFWRLVDVRGIDRLGPNGVAGLTAWLGRVSLRWQSGLVYHYVMAMVMGLMIALSLQAYGQGDIRHLLAGLLR